MTVSPTVQYDRLTSERKRGAKYWTLRVLRGRKRAASVSAFTLNKEAFNPLRSPLLTDSACVNIQLMLQFGVKRNISASKLSHFN